MMPYHNPPEKRLRDEAGSSPLSSRCCLKVSEVVGVYFGIIALACTFKFVLLLFILKHFGIDKYSTSIALDLSIAVVLSALFIARRELFRALSFKISSGTFLLAIGSGILDVNLSLFVALLSSPLFFDSFNLLVVLRAAIISPILEELMFRGIIFEPFAKRYSALPALLISSAAFASFHLTFWNALVGGIVLGMVYLLSKRSILASMIAHATGNLIINIPLNQLLYIHYIRH